MSFEGAIINKLNGGLGRSSDSEDRVIAIIGGMTPPSGMVVNKAYELLDITTAEDLGITESTDDTNGELIHYHLSEAFRLCPGFTFYLIPVAKTSTIATLVANENIKEAIRGIPGINVLLISGIVSPVSSALTDAVSLQTLVSAFAAEHLLIDGIFVEGQGSSSKLEVTAYPPLRTITAPNITYVIGQDPAVAALKTANAYHAAIGTCAGSIAVRKIHEDLGSVDIEEKPRSRKGEENYSLSSESLGYWLSAALSDGTTFKSLTSAEQKELTSRGYMYVGSFADYGGFYWNGCPTAVVKSSDYAYFNLNCIWNKAARIIRKTLIPKIRSKVPTDSSTGYLKSTWVSACEGLVKSKLDAMVSAGNIEDKDVYINPSQSPSEDTALSVKAQVVVGKIVHEFDVDLGLTDSL
jgi:hypothetical protein